MGLSLTQWRVWARLKTYIGDAEKVRLFWLLVYFPVRAGLAPPIHTTILFALVSALGPWPDEGLFASEDL